MDKLHRATVVRLSVVADRPPAARCTGHCCRVFPVSSTVAELREIAADPDQSSRWEAATIADMLVPLGTAVGPAGEVREVFTCHHHDAASGDCAIYGSRPRMCRDYPYDRPCEIDGCTMR